MCKEHLLCAAGVEKRQAGWPLASCHTEILGFNRTFQVLSIRAFCLPPGIPNPLAPLGQSQGSFRLWTITLSPGEGPAQEVWPNRPYVV